MFRFTLFFTWLTWAIGRIITKSRRGGSPGKFDPALVSRYRKETTIQDYSQKSGPHYNADIELKSLLSQGKWSSRIDEIAALIPGERIFEMGSAEGLLASRLALSKAQVLGSEVSKNRYDSAERLRVSLTRKGTIGSNLIFTPRDARGASDLFAGVDTFVACRVIYHFRSMRDLQDLFKKVGAEIGCVFILGDALKAGAFESFGVGFAFNPVKFFNYASSAGMEALLKSHGYETVAGETGFGDPYVIGRKDLGGSPTLIG